MSQTSHPPKTGDIVQVLSAAEKVVFIVEDRVVSPPTQKATISKPSHLDTHWPDDRFHLLHLPAGKGTRYAYYLEDEPSLAFVNGDGETFEILLSPDDQEPPP